MTELSALDVTDEGPWTADRFKLDSIDLYITSICNRRCTFCFLSDDFLGNGERMPVQTVAGIVRWAGSAEEITLLGGEPAAHPDFAEIVALSARTHRVRTVTNGSRRFRAALSNPAVAAGLDRVAVSIDAPSAVSMDRLRGRHAHSDALATVEALAHAGIPFDINCTVVRSCADEFPEMLTFAEQLGAKRLNVHWYSAVGRGAAHAPQETLSAMNWRTRVLDVVRGYESPRADYVVDCELSYAYGLPGEDRKYCAVRARENLQFFPSGAVFSCGLLVENQSSSGYQWRDGSLYPRPGRTEVVKANACGGCAFREGADGIDALCIYNRLLV
jgi:MoaA/NifB/PqqE/SkfB family radical SAM enzyme